MSVIKFTASILVLIVFVIFAQPLQIDSSLTEPDKEYINPSYSFPAPHIKEKGHGYPYPTRIYPSPRRGTNKLAKFLRFCDYIKEEFSKSNMTVREAEAFYTELEKYLEIRDEYYDMPSPNSPKPKAVKLRNRVKVKKINDWQYTIFYFGIGCGCIYVYSEVTRKENGEPKFERIEVWKENNPC